MQIKEFSKNEGKEVTVQGWVANKREGKTLVFLVLRDGSGFAQCVINEDSVEAGAYADAKQLTAESAVELKGTVVKDEKQVGGYELQVSRLQIISIAEEYPISPKEHGDSFLADHRHLWLRSKRQWAIMRIRNEIIYAFHNFFQSEGFVQMDAPIFTGNACEGTSDLFETAYFDKTAYLTQSGQLYGEAMAMAMGKIYTFGPTFRAEKSRTRRHLTEFWMMEPEMAFYDLDDNMDLAEEFIKFLLSDVMEHCAEDMEFFNKRIDTTILETLKNIIDNRFERLTYTDAIHQLQKASKIFTYPVEWGFALQAEHERFLSEKVFKKPIIVFNYPEQIKSFYMKLNEGGETVRAMDVLLPNLGEIIGGSQREENYEVLLQRMRDKGIDPEEYWWYLDLRKFGSAPHSGFGLGFERLVQFVTGMENIRDVIPFPRTPKHAKF